MRRWRGRGRWLEQFEEIWPSGTQPRALIEPILLDVQRDPYALTKRSSQRAWAHLKALIDERRLELSNAQRVQVVDLEALFIDDEQILSYLWRLESEPVLSARARARALTWVALRVWRRPEVVSLHIAASLWGRAQALRG